jgi:hypothetical protein
VALSMDMPMLLAKFYISSNSLVYISLALI